MKESIFNEVLQKVAEVTGADVLNGKSEASSDARYVLITALSKLGYSNAEVATAMGMTRQGVGYLRNSYRRHGRWELVRYCQAIVKWVESEYLSVK